MLLLLLDAMAAAWMVGCVEGVMPPRSLARAQVLLLVPTTGSMGPDRKMRSPRCHHRRIAPTLGGLFWWGARRVSPHCSTSSSHMQLVLNDAAPVVCLLGERAIAVWRVRPDHHQQPTWMGIASHATLHPIRSIARHASWAGLVAGAAWMPHVDRSRGRRGWWVRASFE